MLFKKMRYSKQCKQLSYLAFKQLNLEKNYIKPDFESSNLVDILAKLDEEILELKAELTPSPDFQRIKEELGDCCAMLAGLLAFLEKKQNEKKF